MSGWTLPEALRALVCAAAILGFGYLVASFLAYRFEVDRLARWALAFPAAVAWALVLMLAHILSGGLVFSHPLIVRLLSALAAGLLGAWALAHRLRGSRIDRASAFAAAMLILLSLAVWQTPVFRMASLAPARSDFDWHLGWATQLLKGHSTPTSILPGPIPNYYPWMYHGLVAFLATLTWTRTAYRVLPTLQILQVTAAVLALFALGRELGRSWVAGAGTGLFGALAGGWGFLVARGPALVLNPRARSGLRYLGDLVFVRSYNGAFQSLPPPFPRDVGFSLVAVFLLLLLLGFRHRSIHVLIGAGIVLGLIALTGAEATFLGAGVGLGIGLFPAGLRRRKVLLAVLAPAAALYLVWFGPLLASYFRFGGFVNTSIGSPVSLPAWAILGAWGIMVPFAAIGARHLLPGMSRDVGVRLVVVVTMVAGLLVVVGTLTQGGPGSGFEVLERAHRYWPMLYLGLAVWAGVGLDVSLQVARKVGRTAAIGSGLVVVSVCIASPVLASVAMPERVRISSLVDDALQGRPSSVLGALARAGTGTCVVAAPPTLALSMFGYTGDAFVAVQTLGQQRNFARIRWRDIYRFIPSDGDRLAANALLLRGDVEPDRWREVARRYRLNFVIAPLDRAGALAFRGMRVIDRDRRAGLVLIEVGPCPSRPSS